MGSLCCEVQESCHSERKRHLPRAQVPGRVSYKMVEILRAPHCTTLRSLQCGASVAQNDIPGELWSCGSWRWSWSPRVGCAESLEGFMQRLAGAAHGILDLFELGA